MSPRDLARFLLRSSYRRRILSIRRLKRWPRFTKTTTELLGGPFELVDSASFLSAYDEIFNEATYQFESRNLRPLIIDGGANIGVSVAWFKQRYPTARILAFEPDPKIFQTLATNVSNLKLSDVQLMNDALWSSQATLRFEPDGADGGKIADGGAGPAGALSVPTKRLRDFLNERVDLLKLDIEGAETEVLEDCADRLANVDHLFVEFHSFRDQPQKLHRLLKVLFDAGFRTFVRSPITRRQPFIQRQTSGPIDLFLSVYAYRN